MAILRSALARSLVKVGGGSVAADEDHVVSHSADHVEVEHRDDLVERNGWMGAEIHAAEQAALFAGESDEDDRAILSGPMGESSCGEFQHRDGARAVVIGAVVDLVRVGREASDLAAAEMIVVGADDDELIFMRAFAGEIGDDVVKVRLSPGRFRRCRRS